MKAMIYKKYGEVDVLNLAELDTPTPKNNEVLIKVHATTVTPLDWKFRSGKVFVARLMSGPSKPKNPVLGTEISGEIILLIIPLLAMALGKKMTELMPLFQVMWTTTATWTFLLPTKTVAIVCF